MIAVPVDADRLPRHERAVRAARRRARPPRDLVRDRPRRRSSSRCCSATASRRTRSCRRRCRSTTRTRRGLQYDLAKAKAELAKSKYPKGFKVELLVGAGAQVENAIGQILQQALKQLGINVTLQDSRTRAPSSSDIQTRKYQLGFSYWTMDIADPDELVTFAVDPKGGAQLVLHGLQQPDGDQALAPGAARDEPGEARAQLYAKIQQHRGAGRVPWASSTTRRSARRTSSKLHGFFVHPLGNYHLEDAWLG